MSVSERGHELFVQQVSYVYGALAVINDGSLAAPVQAFILSRVSPWVPRLGAARISDLANTAFDAVAVNDRLILPRERSSQIPHPVDLTPRSEG